jgi:hypothetical protein
VTSSDSRLCTPKPRHRRDRRLHRDRERRRGSHRLTLSSCTRSMPLDSGSAPARSRRTASAIARASGRYGVVHERHAGRSTRLRHDRPRGRARTAPRASGAGHRSRARARSARRASRPGPRAQRLPRLRRWRARTARGRPRTRRNRPIWRDNPGTAGSSVRRAPRTGCLVSLTASSSPCLHTYPDFGWITWSRSRLREIASRPACRRSRAGS